MVEKLRLQPYFSFLAIFSKMKNGLKMEEKLRSWPYFFAIFLHLFSKLKKVGINIQNVNGLRKQSFMTFLDKLSIKIWSAAFLEV